jgi:hypothetical protein
LERAGCRPGALSLVILTYKDVDHAGKVACLQKKYGAKMAVYTFGAGMAERGDMGGNRKARSDRLDAVFRLMSKGVACFFPGGQFEVLNPDVVLTEAISPAE